MKLAAPNGGIDSVKNCPYSNSNFLVPRNNRNGFRRRNQGSSGKPLGRAAFRGAGHGGLAMAAHLSISGCRVNLFNRTPSHIEAIKTRGGINVDGEVSGFAPLNLISSDPAEAIHGCDVLMLVVPATAHRDITGIIAPHLQDGQILVLNPGGPGELLR